MRKQASPESPLVIEQAHATRQLDAAALEQLVRHVVQAEGGVLRHLNVVLAGRALVLRLNRAHLGHDYATDVLSFSLAEAPPEETSAPPVVDGEVYVDLDTAAERHAEFGASFEEEARRYVVHGLLHLLGHDDTTPAARARMRRLEDRYLKAGASSTGS